MITELKPNQMFVFGTNAQGFHGAGSAGYAMLHVTGNKWRTTKVPNTDKYLDEVPKGTQGYWAVKGTARGPMVGIHGISYGIQTVIRPGAKRSIPLSEIRTQLCELCDYAANHLHLEILLTRIGCGYAGYTVEEMEKLISTVPLLKTYTNLTNMDFKNG